MEAPQRPARLTSLDALRGTVMVLMALDHTRDFFHAEAMVRSPTDLTTATAATFLTRWVTHFCAPVFLFTAGLGAALWQTRHATSPSALTRYLLTRGLWLIFLELIVMRLAFFFSLTAPNPVFLITLWALGASMILLAALHYLRRRLLFGLSLATILLHNLADKVPSATFGSFSWLWKLLHEQGVIAAGGLLFITGYPLLPLAATLAAGYCTGAIFRRSNSTRQRTLTRAGLAMLAGFLLLRTLNLYGDPAPWTTQPTTLATLLSFLNCTKQPASLCFLLMTLAPALLLLAWFDRHPLHEGHPLVTFGRVPLLYFLGHFFALHFLLVAVAAVYYGPGPYLWLPVPSMGGPRQAFPPGFGLSLATTYAVWAFIVILMYPLCRWFAGVKERRRDWWLGYL